MLKKILAAFLGSLAAFWVSLALCSIMSIIAMFMIIGISANSTKVDQHSILYLDLSGPINDRAQNRSVQEFIMGNNEAAQNLDEILQAIDYAADDSNIDGIYLNCGGSDLGYASREELTAALSKFKKSGKWIYSYADSYTQSDYYVASAASKMYINPVGTVDIKGLGSSIPFFKNALDKLGIEMQIVKVGTFKSAVEPYILTEASEPSRLQTKVYLDAIWNNVKTTIADNRSVSTSNIDTWADSLISTVTGDKLQKIKLVNGLKYRREFENMLRKLTNIELGEDLHLVSTSDYLSANSRPQRTAENKIDHSGHIAVLYAVGEISDNGNSGIVGSNMVDQIIELAEDDNVKGLVMRVNSPGGSAFASEQIWEALQYFKSKHKPFYVSMGDYAASGGYYISCGADKIYSDVNTITGSIGIFGMIPNTKGLLNDKLGVNFSNIETNENATFPTYFQPMTESQRAAMQRNVEDGYKLFTSRVAKGRKLPIDSVLSIAEGRVWDGKTALKLHLVDNIGGLDATIAAMAKTLKTDKYNYISYPKVSQSTLEMLLSQSSNFDASIKIDGLSAQDVKYCTYLLNRIQSTKGGLQARMEDVTIK